MNRAPGVVISTCRVKSSISSLARAFTIDGKERIFGLDLLRAIAIFNVVYLHAYDYVRADVPLRVYSWFVIADGVTVFFVLSGFLIGTILIRTFERPNSRAADLAIFWVRRWCRTLPNYFLLLAVAALLSGRSAADLIPLLARFATFSQNLYTRHPNFFFEAWSLSVEEWFYLAIPILLWTASRFCSFRSSLLMVIIGCLIGVTSMRMSRALSLGAVDTRIWSEVFRGQVITRLDSLIYGVLGAYLGYYHPVGWKRFAGVAGIIGAALLLILKVGSDSYLSESHGFYDEVLSFSFVSLAVLLTLPFLSSFRPNVSWATRIITFVSIVSYAVYIINFSFIRNWLIPNLQVEFPHVTGGVWWYGSFWLATLSLSYLLYCCYERPVMNLREKLGNPRPRIPDGLEGSRRNVAER